MKILGAPFLPRLCFCGKGGKAQISSSLLNAVARWGCPEVSILRPGKALTLAALSAFLLLTPLTLPAQQHFDGGKALEYARQFVAIGPRWPTSPGHAKAEAFFRAQFQRNHDQFEEDTFTADTSIGPVLMHNFIARFPGTKPGIIVLATHYETNYPLRSINFVGANDGGSTTGLLLAIGDRLREQAAHSPGKKLPGYSVWLLFDDGEESFPHAGTSPMRSSAPATWLPNGPRRHLSQIKAFILADMIGDKDLDISTNRPRTAWLFDLVQQAVKKFGYEQYFFKLTEPVEDDHLPFVQRGVPSIDIIDLDYGPDNSYHHTAQDTMDKISANSLTIDGDVLLKPSA